MSAISTAFLLAQQDFKIKDFKTYQTSEDDFDLLFPNATEAADINFQETIEELSNVQSFTNKSLDEKNVEIAKCSSTSQETYNFEEDAKQTAAELKEIIYTATDDRIKKTLDFLENNLDPANIDLVLKEYEKLTGEKDIKNHFDIIFGWNFIGEMKANKILDKLLNFKNENSKIQNKHWQGDEHSVIREGSIITITNKETNKTRQIDLAILLKNYDTSKEREELIETLQTLPGEVLMDIAIEQTTLIAKDDTAKNLGYYDIGKDQVALKSDSSIRTIVHEFGHSIDYNDSYGNNVSYVKNCNTFMEIFNEEIEKFIADGNDINQPGADATKNEREMFAACYTLLMTGDCSNRETIEKYFPRTLGYAKQLLEHIRGFSDSERH